MSDNSQPKSITSVEAWRERVAAYLGLLAEVNETIDLILDETRVGTVNVRSEEVERSREELTEAIGRLEEMLAQRQELLTDPAAPKKGITLRDKLMSTRHIDDARLLKRCDEVSAAIELTRERCLALFVCQFHLASLGQDLINLLSGATGPATYQAGGAMAKRDQSGGGLFNEAA